MVTDGMSKNQLVYNLLKKSLDVSSLKGKVIANNIANVNTKGFKRSDVSFEDTLKQQNDDVLQLNASDARHFTDEDKSGEIKVNLDNASSMREDGNNVDIDYEMINQASNSLMYDALINQVNSRMSMMKYVIDGGRG